MARQGVVPASMPGAVPPAPDEPSAVRSDGEPTRTVARRLDGPAGSVPLDGKESGRSAAVGSEPSLPAAFAELSQVCRVTVSEAERADEWSASLRRAALAEYQRAEAAIAAGKAKLLNAEREAGTWALHGDRDMAAWAARTSRQGRGAGVAQVSQAATLAAMPAVADALVDGPVTPAHVAQLTRATGASRTLGERLATPEGQAEVVALAERLDAGAFGRALAHEAARIDPAGRQRAHDEQYANRSFHLSHGPSGTVVSGRFDSVAGNLVQRAIDALCPRPGADDDRDRGQRQADAVVAMASTVLSDPSTTPGSVVPAQVTLLVSEATWAALRTPDRGAAEPGRGSTRDVLARLEGVEPVADEDGHVLPASEVAMALCDCQITRMVMDAQSVPIDEGRGERLFTAHQRKAVIARDGGGCAIPGCAIPARYTQLHHVTWWSRGGPTDLVEAMQGCHFHHKYIHDHDIAITRNSRGEYVFMHPDGRLMPGSARPDPPPGAKPCPVAEHRELELELRSA